ncbi:MAG: YsnF/AvaK domain-containing protein, partial [Acidobacteriales bacterium]|nr:YsnF/AvaK domain-containing protein [Terriglobales bacterium]
MKEIANTISAFFSNERDAANAVRDLRQAGFRSDQIGTSIEDYDAEQSEARSHEPGFWDKVTEFFSGDTGYENRDTGAGEGSREEGPVVGRTLTIPDSYRERMNSGGVFVTIHGENSTQAEQILVRNHGEIDREFAGTQRDYMTNQGNAVGQAEQRRDFDATDRADAEGLGQEGQRIQLLSEVLNVRKDRVQRGEVRLRKEVVSETQTVQVPVRREELVIERTPVEGQRMAAGQIGSEKEIRVPLSEERATVEKRPVVREEVRVGKREV